MINNDEHDLQTGTTEFKTVKAGCGICFDPETIDENSGFDFSEAGKLNTACSALTAAEASQHLKTP